MAVESLLRLYPSRRFVLVGDSGERDPEIYGSLARNWPDRIASILIREVGPGEKETGRYAAAFRELPRKRWRVFREPSELGEFTPD
jgi:phosphatidate phosphatase APP1